MACLTSIAREISANSANGQGRRESTALNLVGILSSTLVRKGILTLALLLGCCSSEQHSRTIAPVAKWTLVKAVCKACEVQERLSSFNPQLEVLELDSQSLG